MEDLGTTLHLVMGCKISNKLFHLLSQLLTIRKQLCKAMIDISLQIFELYWLVLENISIV